MIKIISNVALHTPASLFHENKEDADYIRKLFFAVRTREESFKTCSYLYEGESSVAAHRREPGMPAERDAIPIIVSRYYNFLNAPIEL